MTYPLYVPAPQQPVAKHFMPATGNLAVGLLEAAIDDIVGIFVLLGETLDDLSYHIWQEASETLSQAFQQLRKA